MRSTCWCARIGSRGLCLGSALVRKRGADSISESGMKRMSGGAKRQCARALALTRRPTANLKLTGLTQNLVNSPALLQGFQSHCSRIQNTWHVARNCGGGPDSTDHSNHAPVCPMRGRILGRAGEFCVAGDGARARGQRRRRGHDGPVLLPGHQSGSAALPRCAVTHPLHTICAYIFGASIPGATVRPDPL
jgi:hypothetical protein